VASRGGLVTPGERRPLRSVRHDWTSVRSSPEGKGEAEKKENSAEREEAERAHPSRRPPGAHPGADDGGLGEPAPDAKKDFELYIKW